MKSDCGQNVRLVVSSFDLSFSHFVPSLRLVVSSFRRSTRRFVISFRHFDSSFRRATRRFVSSTRHSTALLRCSVSPWITALDWELEKVQFAYELHEEVVMFICELRFMFFLLSSVQSVTELSFIFFTFVSDTIS